MAKNGDAPALSRRREMPLATARRLPMLGGMMLLRFCLGLVLGAGVAVAAPDAKPAAPKPAPVVPAKKVAPPDKIEGVKLTRAQGGFLGMAIKNNNFVLTFFDAEQHKTAPDVSLATVRWPVKYQPGDERTVLNPGSDGVSLTSARIVRAPHNFKVYLSLFVAGNDDPVESYVFDYRD